MKPSILATSAVLIALSISSGDAARAQSGVTMRLSVSSAGVQANGDSAPPAMTPDGRFVVFRSYADNLVAGDVNGAGDIFLRDRLGGTTSLVSVSLTGQGGNQGCDSATSITPDGRYVAFASFASNLVPGDTNGMEDVFVRDVVTGQTTRASVSGNGSQVSVGGNGNEGNGDSNDPAISADGRYVAFTSKASNLVPGDSNFAYDVFVHDRVTGLTVMASVSSSGVQGNTSSYAPLISADGRYVAFPSLANNLVPGDSNNERDAFVHDMLTGTTELDSVDSSGIQGNDLSFPTAISPDGRYVAFHSGATNLVPNDTNHAWDAFVHDRQTGLTERVSVDSNGNAADLSSLNPALSSDGRYVAFMSSATNLVPGDHNGWPDVFVHDRATGLTERVSVNSNGVEGNLWGGTPAISDDGRFVAFDAASTNLVPGDTNGFIDIFLRDREPPVPWTDLGHALAGTAGPPSLQGTGSLAGGSAGTIALASARPLAATWMVIGLVQLDAPFKGGTLVPAPLVLVPFTTNASGAFTLPFVMPAGVPAGTGLVLQAWIVDPVAIHGFAASNAIAGTTP